MTPACRALLAAALMAIFPLSSLPAADERAAEINPTASADQASHDERVGPLIQQLGAEDFAAREKAQAELAQLGLEAFDALHAAQNHNDPEIALRARHLVRSMAVRWFQESDSPDVVRILKGYGELSPDERKNRMDRLATLDNRQGAAALCRLSRFETADPLSKYAALKIMEQTPPAEQADKEQLSQTITEIIGNSKRPAATWLRLYVRTLADAPGSLADWDAATRAEHSALAKHPESTSRETVRDLYRWQVELLQRLERDQEAVAVMRRTFSLLDGTHEQLTEIMDWLIHRQAWDVVLEVADRFSTTIEAHPLLLYRLAETYQNLGRTAEAQAAAERAIALRADNLDEHWRVAFTLHELGLQNWAEREYRELIKKTTPGSALDFRCRGRLAEILHDQAREIEAGDTLKVLCDLMDKDEMHKDTCVTHFRDPEAVYSRMHYFYACHHREQKDYTQEEQLLNKAIENDPMDADALIALYRLPNQTEERRAKTKKLIEDATKQFRAEMIEFETAADGARESEELRLSNEALASACNQLAWLVANTFGDFEEALKASHKSLEVRPNYAGFLDTLGRCYFAKGDLDNAIKYQTQAVKLDPHSGQIRRQLDYFKKEKAARGTANP